MSDVILNRSLIYKRKNKGPCIKPWETYVSNAPIQKNILEFSVLTDTCDMHLINKL
jgi:hypothetical protein